MAKLDHLGLPVADRKRAADWYVGILGLEVEFDIPDAGVTAVRDEADFTIFFNESPVAHAESTLYFQVESVDTLHRSLADMGMEFVHEPRVNPWGYGAELTDPDGHRVRLPAHRVGAHSGWTCLVRLRPPQTHFRGGAEARDRASDRDTLTRAVSA